MMLRIICLLLLFNFTNIAARYYITFTTAPVVTRHGSSTYVAPTNSHGTVVIDSPVMVKKVDSGRSIITPVVSHHVGTPIVVHTLGGHIGGTIKNPIAIVHGGPTTTHAPIAVSVGKTKTATGVHLYPPKELSSPTVMVTVGPTHEVIGALLIFPWRSTYWQQAEAAREALSMLMPRFLYSSGMRYQNFGSTDFSLFQNALTLYQKVYSDAAIFEDGKVVPITIDGEQSANFVVATIHTLFEKFLLPSMLQLNNVVSLQVFGKEFYNAVDLVMTVYQQYMSYAQIVSSFVQTNWDVVYNPFAERMAGIAYSIYLFALNTIANKNSQAITADDVAQAKKYFDKAQQVWQSTMIVPGPQQSPNDLKLQALGDLATIYNASVQNLSNQMEPIVGTPTLANIVGATSSIMVTMSQIINQLQEVITLWTQSGQSSQDILQTYTARLARIQEVYNALIALQSASVPASLSQIQAFLAISSTLQGTGMDWLLTYINRLGSLFLGDYYVAQAATSGIGASYNQLFSSFNDAMQAGGSLSDVSSVTAAISTLAQEMPVIATAMNSAYQAYTQAVRPGQNGIPHAQHMLSDDQMQHIYAQQTLATTVQSLCQNIATVCKSIMSTSLTSLSSQTSYSSLQAAMSPIQNVISAQAQAMQSVDTSYTQLPAAAQQIYAYFVAAMGGSFTNFINQYVACQYQTIAQQLLGSQKLQDATVNMRSKIAVLELAAYGYFQYLSSAAQKKIMGTLQALPLLSVAQNAVAIATKSNQFSDWEAAISSSQGAYIVSGMSSLLHPVLAYNNYRSCLQDCITASPQDATSTQMLIVRYRLYLLDMANKNKGAAVVSNRLALTSGITQLIAQAHTYNGTAQGPVTATGYAPQIGAQQSLLAWTKTADIFVQQCTQAFNDQMAATSKLAPALFGMRRVVNSDHTITYSSSLIVSSVTLADPQSALAQLYENQGDWAVAQAMNMSAVQAISGTCNAVNYHEQAARAYWSANGAYALIGDSTKAQLMNQLMMIELGLSRASNLVIVPMLKVHPVIQPGAFMNYTGSVPVYLKYFMAPLVEPIPSTIPLVTQTILQDLYPPAGTPRNKSAIEADILQIFAGIYLYNLLTAQGEYAAFTASGSNLIGALVAPSASLTNLSYGAAIGTAQDYYQQLQSWYSTGYDLGISASGVTVPQQRSAKLMVSLLSPQLGQTDSSLMLCNLPVPPQPILQSNVVENSALLFYEENLQQFQSALAAYTQLSEADRVTYCQNNINQLQQNIAATALSQAYSLYIKAQYMQGIVTDTTLISLLLRESDELTTLNSALSSLKTKETIPSLDVTSPLLTTSQQQATIKAFLDAVSTVIGYYLAATTYTSSTDQVNWGVMGACYEAAGDFVVSCLVGDPQATQYQSLVSQATYLYGMAQGSYNPADAPSTVATETSKAQPMAVDAAQAKRVGIKIGNVWMKVGRACASYGYYIASATYPKAALDCFSQAISCYCPSASASSPIMCTDDATKRAQLHMIASYFSGALQFFSTWYAQRWVAPNAMNCSMNEGPPAQVPVTTIQLQSSDCSPVTTSSGAQGFLTLLDQSNNFTVSTNGAIFEQLVSDYTGTTGFGAPASESATYQALNSAILDSMIYFSAAKQVLCPLIRPASQCASATSSGSITGAQTTLGSAAVARYIQDVASCIGTIPATGATATLATGLMYGVLTLAQVQSIFTGNGNCNSSQLSLISFGPQSGTPQQPVSVPSLDQFLQDDTALSYTDQILSEIYTLIQNCYIYDYLGADCPAAASPASCLSAQLPDVATALQTEENNISSPAGQYLGSFGSN